MSKMVFSRRPGILHNSPVSQRGELPLTEGESHGQVNTQRQKQSRREAEKFQFNRPERIVDKGELHGPCSA